MGDFCCLAQHDGCRAVLFRRQLHGSRHLFIGQAVTGAGLVRALSAGFADVQASFGGFDDSALITVNPPVVVSIELLPASVLMGVGETFQLTVLAHYSDGSSQDVTLAAFGVDRILDKRELTRARDIYQRHPQYRGLELAELRQIVNSQAHILAVDYQRALDGLAVMLPGRQERAEAVKLAQEIAIADEQVSTDERQVLDAICNRLNLDRG